VDRAERPGWRVVAQAAQVAADIKGLRIRSFDANSTRTLANAGAAPIQLAWGDLIPQLSTGGIDAVVTSVDGGRQLTIWDHTPYFTALNYSMALYISHCNMDAYEALPEATKTAIEEANAPAEAKAWDGMRESIVASYKLLAAAGGTAVEPAPEDIIALLQEAAKPIYADWVKNTGERGEAILAELGKTL
jgi:TRAP-type C4-dicarboxylate transport system substrate-binding protein